MKWEEDLAHEKAKLRTILLHKFSPGQHLDSVAMEVLLERGYRLRGFTLSDLGMELWRCRLANVPWAYGETKELAMERAVKIWVWGHHRPSWER